VGITPPGYAADTDPATPTAYFDGNSNKYVLSPDSVGGFWESGRETVPAVRVADVGSTAEIANAPRAMDPANTTQSAADLSAGPIPVEMYDLYGVDPAERTNPDESPEEVQAEGGADDDSVSGGGGFVVLDDYGGTGVAAWSGSPVLRSTCSGTNSPATYDRRTICTGREGWYFRHWKRQGTTLVNDGTAAGYRIGRMTLAGINRLDWKITYTYRTTSLWGMTVGAELTLLPNCISNCTWSYSTSRVPWFSMQT
jgi:hypothetical protein